MLITAQQSFTRQTTRKLQLVAGQVRTLPLVDAIQQLAVIDRKSTVVLLKVVKQALANAKNNHGLNLDQVALKDIRVDQGPTFKRFRAVSRGRGHGIQKRTSHVTVVLETKSAEPVVTPLPTEAKKPVAAAKQSTPKSKTAQPGTKKVQKKK